MVAYPLRETRGSVRQKQTEGKILRPVGSETCLRRTRCIAIFARSERASRMRNALPRGQASTECWIRPRSVLFDGTGPIVACHAPTSGQAPGYPDPEDEMTRVALSQ